MRFGLIDYAAYYAESPPDRVHFCEWRRNRVTESLSSFVIFIKIIQQFSRVIVIYEILLIHRTHIEDLFVAVQVGDVCFRAVTIFFLC